MRFKTLIILLTLGFLMASTVTLCWTFLTAYSNPLKEVRVTINTYNEAIPELIMMIILFPISVAGTWIIAGRDWEVKE